MVGEPAFTPLSGPAELTGGALTVKQSFPGPALLIGEPAPNEVKQFVNNDAAELGRPASQGRVQDDAPLVQEGRRVNRGSTAAAGDQALVRDRELQSPLEPDGTAYEARESRRQDVRRQAGERKLNWTRTGG